MKVDWVESKGHDSNIYIIRDKLNLMIDTGTGKNSEKIKNNFENKEFNFEDLDAIVNTHFHFDHIGGNPDFLDLCNCEIWASEDTAEILREGNEEKTFAMVFGNTIDPMEVSRVLKDGEEIKIGEVTLKIIATPGHTHGDISLYEPNEKKLFSGDTVFKGGIGRTDLPHSNKQQMKHSLEKLSSLEVKSLYPGHGPIAEKNGNKYIRQGLDFFI